ncbi:MAG TPA: DNA polymerase III subunit alpha, partial [Cytophagaceae bacterium]
YKTVPEMKAIREGNDLRAEVLKNAELLEGSVRNTGVHAAGIIIAPDDLTEYIPLATAKDSDLLVTQFEGSVIEEAGMLKMDFLGLKTLTIIKDAIKMIKARHGIEIDPDKIPLDDVKTYELYQRGETNGTFQFESVGMQKYLKELKPDKFDDLIAMNALYRPGPLEYIPNFIRRKHGLEPIEYDIPDMEEYLKDTYGITVYQEQVMLLSQKLANFTKGDADVLRKAMGKKQKDVLDKMKSKFLDGCHANGHDLKKAEKVWTDWEAFAAYAFNKSHATCYSVVAFQTAYLKAHYPAEYMASVLTHNMSNIEKVSFFMDECKRIGVPVLGPDINESGIYFEVNKEGQIRFGLGAVKGTGEAAVESIISERNENGPFTSFFNFSERVNLRTVNKKTFECMAYAGAFDCFPEIHRAQYFHVPNGDTTNLIEKAIKYGNACKNEKNNSQASLFGGAGQSEMIPEPKVVDCEPWSDIVKLKFEKDVVGFYISGHPLDQFKLEMENFCTCSVGKVMEYKNREINIAGIVSKVNVRQSKNGKSFVLFSIEDYDDTADMALFGEDYLKHAHFIKPGEFLFIRGKVQNRFGNPDMWEFKPIHFQLLADVREKMCKNILLSLDVKKLSSDLISDLEKHFADHPGNCGVKVFLSDPSENIHIETFSRKYKVSPNNTLLDELKKLDGVNYKILA